MSTKYLVVKEAPKDLPKGSYVIKTPDFLKEIQENKGREPRGNITASTHLRYIVGTIGERYDQNLSAYTIKPHLFEGRKYENEQELSKIVVEMLKAQYPAIFEKELDYQIKHRPANTNMIYYVGDFLDTKPFFVNGIDAAEPDTKSKKPAAKATETTAE